MVLIRSVLLSGKKEKPNDKWTLSLFFQFPRGRSLVVPETKKKQMRYTRSADGWCHSLAPSLAVKIYASYYRREVKSRRQSRVWVCWLASADSTRIGVYIRVYICAWACGWRGVKLLLDYHFKAGPTHHSVNRVAAISISATRLFVVTEMCFERDT